MLQVYTGNGKGKTTAAIGLAMRALGAGVRVFLMQFMKSLAYSEQPLLRTLPNLALATTGKPCFLAFEGTLTAEQIRALGDDVLVFPKGQPPADYCAIIAEGLRTAGEAMRRDRCGLLILDELTTALYFGLLDRATLENFLDAAPPDTELVITGRYAPQWLIDRADLVTEMTEVKHYANPPLSSPPRRGFDC